MTQSWSTTADEATKVEANSDGQGSSPSATTTIEIGQVVAGRYTVTDRIGQGAMGSVMRAQDARLRRAVALKLLRLDTIDASSRERMVREAHAMAQLSHPNVVAIYDVEETRHGILLVMELVEGQTLREWVTPQRAWSSVVAAYVSAARGLLAAHREGIVHRDFKPANVLIGQDGGQVKVADFGLAKLAGEDDLRHSVPDPAGESLSPSSGPSSGNAPLTEAGMVMGTPRYMAPEQHAGKDVTPAADQFALCVAIWEGLHGRAPYDDPLAKQAGPPAWERNDVRQGVIRAVERGLSPTPDDRWPDLGSLIEQLEPPAQRPWIWLATAVAGTAVVAAAGASNTAAPAAAPCTTARAQIDETWDAPRRQEIHRALSDAAPHFGEQVASRVEDQLNDFAARWVSSQTEACEATLVRSEQSTEVLDLRMACLQRAKGELSALAGVLAEADENTVSRAHILVDKLPSLDRCSNVEALRAEVPPPTTPQMVAHVEQAREQIARANGLKLAGKFEEALASVEALPADADEIEYAPLRAELLLLRGEVIERQGNAEAAQPIHREALGHALENAQWTTAIRASLRLAQVSRAHLNQPAQAAAYYDLALGMSRRPDIPADVKPWIHNGHAGVLDGLDDQEGAMREHQKALELRLELYGPDDWRTALSYFGVGGMHFRLREFDQARALFEKAYRVQEAELGPDHPFTVSTRGNLASILLISGNAAEAEPVCKEIYAQSRRINGDLDSSTVHAAANLSAAYTVLRKYDEAYHFLTELLDQAKAAGFEGRPHVLTLRDTYAIVLSELGRADEAVDEARALLEIRLERQGAEHRETSRSHYVLGDLLRKAGKLDEAQAQLQRSLEIDEKIHGAEHPDRVSALVALGRTHAEAGRRARALDTLREAWSVIREHDISLDIRGECAFALAQILVDDPSSRDEAVEFGHQAKKAIAEDVGTENPLHAEVETWLAEHDAT